jgi:hypothetical protein
MMKMRNCVRKIFYALYTAMCKQEKGRREEERRKGIVCVAANMLIISLRELDEDSLRYVLSLKVSV